MTNSMVVVSDYDPEWPARAETLIAELRASSGAEARRIDHIGSTAIPGMAAKNVLDIQVSVIDLETASSRFEDPLRARGFVWSEYQRDHVPAGCGDDPARWEKRLWLRRGHDGADVNLHVRVSGSPNERLAILFRDWIRAHRSAIPPYSAIKRALAAEAPDIGWYSDLKDPIVDLVIAIAEEWVVATGWSIQH